MRKEESVAKPKEESKKKSEKKDESKEKEKEKDEKDLKHRIAKEEEPVKVVVKADRGENGEEELRKSTYVAKQQQQQQQQQAGQDYSEQKADGDVNNEKFGAGKQVRPEDDKDGGANRQGFYLYTQKY